MGVPTYLYHKKYGAKVFDSDEVEEMEAEGWRDNPDDAEKARARRKPDDNTAETNGDESNAAPEDSEAA